MRIPDEVTEALNYLEENGYVSKGDLRMPEDVLPPDSKHLKAILAFRKQTDINDGIRIKWWIEQTREHLKAQGIIDPFEQAYVLRKLGTARDAILKVTRLKKPEFEHRIAFLFRGKSNYGRKKIGDVEALLQRLQFSFLHNFFFHEIKMQFDVQTQICLT